MPDVKWYSSSTASTGVAVASGSGTTNRLMKFDASDAAADSLLSDDATNVSLVSGAAKLPDYSGSGAATLRGTTHATYGLGVTSGGETHVIADASGGGLTVGQSNGTRIFYGAGTGFGISGNFANAGGFYWDTSTVNPARAGAAANGLVDFGAGSFHWAGIYADRLAIANGSTALPASPYLILGGTSGAGGTPTTSHLTAGSGVAIYTQQAHDAAATVFVIAYSLSGSMRYISIPLDGTTATWTHNATRP